MQRAEQYGQRRRVREERRLGSDELRVVEGDTRSGRPLATDHLTIHLGAGAAIGSGDAAARRGEVELEERVLQMRGWCERDGEIAGVETGEESSGKVKEKEDCLVERVGTEWMRRRRKRSREEKVKMEEDTTPTSCGGFCG